MKIGFYGHSTCAYRSQESFIDIIAKKFNAEIVNTGVRQGSEERILYELKKTREIDLAVIFHSRPSFIFMPNCNRDFLLGHMSDVRMQYLLFESDNDLKTQFKSLEEFKNAINVFQTHFYNSDMLLNRFYGTLMQIDKYLNDKKISCIHVLEKETSLPKWLKFTTGIVDCSIMKIAREHKLPLGEKVVANVMTKEGNLKVADALESLIKSLRS